MRSLFYIVYNKSFDRLNPCTGRNLVDYVYIKDSTDSVVERVSVGQLKNYLLKEIFIGGVDSCGCNLVFRPATKLPYFKDWCIANNRLDILNQVNDSTDVSSVSIGTKVDINWKCTFGHTWRARLDSRIYYNQGCPECANQFFGIGTSFTEQALYYYLVKYIQDLKNRVRLNNYEVDMFSQSNKLVIEYDGSFHNHDRLDFDIRKTNHLQSLGFRVIRVRNICCPSLRVSNCITIVENGNNLSDCINSILHLVIRDFKSRHFNLDADREKILQMYKKFTSNNIMLTHKDLCTKYYDFTQNKDLPAERFTSGSGEYAWWKCRICTKPVYRQIKEFIRGHDTCDGCKKFALVETKLSKGSKLLMTVVPSIVNFYSVDNKFPLKFLLSSSNEVITLICPKCNSLFTDRVNNINRRGYVKCTICNDKGVVKCSE